MNQSLLVFILGLTSLSIFAQNDPVLFTVGDSDVHLSEFKYIYNKTNADVEKTEEAVMDHFELYKKFKLKVAFAKDQQIDTIPSTREELEKYKNQLSDAYLLDKEVVEKLAKEVYDRQQYDVDIAHIMVLVSPNATEAVIEAAQSKIDSLHVLLSKGASFEKLAVENSDDPTAKDNNGRLGFVNAMLPNGFHELEAAAYSLKKGAYSKPVRSSAGFHIVKLLGKRNARGQMEVAHVFIRDSEKSPNSQAKAKIGEAYAKLINNGSFADVVKEYSEDEKSNKQAGYIGTFGINKYEKTFEDACFALKNNGDYTRPFKTKAGWHIVTRISKVAPQPYEDQLPRLIDKVKKDGRFLAEKNGLVQHIIDEKNIEVNQESWEEYVASVDPQFTSFRWSPKSSIASKPLISSNSSNYTIGDFEAFAKKNTRERLQKGRQLELTAVADYMLELFIDDVAKRIYQADLPEKYPELKALLREYEEGILLFEITKRNVWDRANDDSLGLQKFWEANIKGTDKYKWDERATIVFYELDKKGNSFLPKLRKWASTKDSDYIIKKINKKGKFLTIMRQTIEKGQKEEIDALTWKSGFLSPTKVNEVGASTFMKVDKVLPPAEKKLSEARGYIVAEYQDYLEKQWVESLLEKYPIKVNEDVLAQFIKQ